MTWCYSAMCGGCPHDVRSPSTRALAGARVLDVLRLLGLVPGFEERSGAISAVREPVMIIRRWQMERREKEDR